MNCPGQRAIVQARLAELSRAADGLAEFGNVHRYEPSGALHGLMRVRGFTQMTPIFLHAEQMAMNALRSMIDPFDYKDFGFEEIVP